MFRGLTWSAGLKTDIRLMGTLEELQKSFWTNITHQAAVEVGLKFVPIHAEVTAVTTPTKMDNTALL